MAWSYDETNLDTSTPGGRINVVRFLVGDTDSSNQIVQNEEITFALSETNNNVYNAGAWVARSVGAKYSSKVDIELDGQLSAKYSDLSSKFYNLALQLESQAKRYSSSFGVFAGGITKTQLESGREDNNKSPTSFRREQFHNFPYDGDDDESGYY